MLHFFLSDDVKMLRRLTSYQICPSAIWFSALKDVSRTVSMLLEMDKILDACDSVLD